MKKRFLILVTLAIFDLTGAAYPQNKSIYTSTKTSDCKTIESVADSYVGECSGVGGYKVQVVEGDIRQTLNVVTRSRKKFELNFWNFYGGFSWIGEKIEWRTRSGVPVALIARYRVADPEYPTKTTSYLMVAKVGPSSSCVTDVIAPGPEQNEYARRSADAATGKSCRTVE